MSLRERKRKKPGTEDRQTKLEIFEEDKRMRRGDETFEDTKKRGVTSTGSVPDRSDNDGNGLPAPFILEQDRVPLLLLRSLYRQTPTQTQGFWEITSQGTDSVKSWINSDTGQVIVGLRGTVLNAPKGLLNLLDDTVIAGFTPAAPCELQLVSVGKTVVRELLDKGYKNIVVVGHSLGGTSAFCLKKAFPEIARAISFNGGAPITGGAVSGPGEGSIFYHIVGDLISTHMNGATTEMKRINLLESGKLFEQTSEQLQLDGIRWDDPSYYHSIDRFMNRGREWKEVSAQFEQNSIENFVHKPSLGQELFNILGVVTSKSLDAYDQVQKVVCNTPVPGAVASRSCNESGPTQLEKIAGGAVGAIIGTTVGFITGGPVGAVAGAVAGASVGTGEKGILDQVGLGGKIEDTVNLVSDAVGGAAEVAQKINANVPLETVGKLSPR